MAAHERIVSTAYALFTWRGVRAVGIDEIISQSGVAKATMYPHFRTKKRSVGGAAASRTTVDPWPSRAAIAAARQHPKEQLLHLRRVP